MKILTLRTDKPEAEIGIYSDETQMAYHQWQAHRQLAESLHTTIKVLLETEHMDWNDINALVIYKGPGSFTGLRIGFTVANTLADGLGIPIVGSNGDDWQVSGVHALQNGQNDYVALPLYGSEPNVSTPKK